MSLLKRKAEVLAFYHNPSPSPSVNVGDLALASDNTQVVSTLNWGNGGYFSLESGKTCQHFFSMIVACKTKQGKIKSVTEVRLIHGIRVDLSYSAFENKGLCFYFCVLQTGGRGTGGPHIDMVYV